MERKKGGSLIFLSLSSGAVVNNNFCYERLRSGEYSLDLILEP